MENVQVQHYPDRRRFEILVGTYRAVLEYLQPGGRIIFTHTEVPEALEGQGLGSKLAQTGLEYARSKSLRVMPLCPFVAEYIRRHPEYRPLVLEGFNL